MQIHIRQISANASEAMIRSHRITIDRPPEKGGTDSGPMGGELFLAAIGGCFMSTLLAAIRSRNAEISGVQTEVTATMASEPARFTGIDLCVTADCENPELLQHLVEIAERGCIMVNTLRGKLDLRVRIGVKV